MLFRSNLATVYQHCAAAIAPIFINKGIKIKVLTYLSYGLPTIAFEQTTWGMTSKNGVLVADPHNFVNQVNSLLANKKLRQQLSQAGRKNLDRYHSPKVLAKFFSETGML